MATTHIPGPWTVRYDREGRPGAIGQEGHMPHASVFPRGEIGCRAEDVANARLIAAAPDLLEACIEAQRMVQNCPGNWENGVREMLGAAIAKATAD